MGRERGDRATTGWMVVPFDAMGKFVGKRSGVGGGQMTRDLESMMPLRHL